MKPRLLLLYIKEHNCYYVETISNYVNTIVTVVASEGLRASQVDNCNYVGEKMTTVIIWF